jgi:DNA mismatch repair protein MutL
VSDLVGIATFGFRGEALPAIASVSRFTLSTSDEDGSGTELTVHGGRLERVEPVARQRGTTVTVRTLFYNTPARRKFLRSTSSELRAAHDAVATLALAHPHVTFELHADQVLRLHAPSASGRADRVRAVWGREVSESLLPMEYAAGAYRIAGFIQRPADARPTGRRVQLFVNGRPFRDPFLVRAAEAGYRSAIHPGDRPSLLLDLQVRPDDVDVNVHPAKLEVRFRDRVGLERTVEDGVRQALGHLAAAATLGHGAGSGSLQPMWERTDAWQGQAAPQLFDTEAPETAPAAAAEAPRLSTMPVLQVFDTYLVYPGEDGIVVVDQHSAHERVLYEAAMRQLTGMPVAAQHLLVPLTVELTDEELDAVEAHRELLETVGYEVAPFGGRSVVIATVPAPHLRFDAGTCFREMVADLARGRFGGWANQLERFAATYACRAAVKAGDRLDDAAVRELLLRLFACELPPHDVHGRSTIVQLPREELERRFGRG